MIGDLCHVCKNYFCFFLSVPLISHEENIASHRAQRLLTLLPLALTFAATEIEPEFEPLRVSI